MRKTALRFPTILLLAAAAAAPLGARAAAGEGEGPRVRTDRAVIEPPPAPPLPKAGGVLADPAFGTRILRVTDERDGPENQHAYSYWCAMNADSTRLIVSSGGRPMLYRFDPRAFRLLGKEALLARPPPGGGTPGWEDAVWSARDPGLLYCREGLRLWACNVRTGAYTLVKDFSKDLPPGHLRQMSASDDGQTFAFSRQEPKWRVVGYLVWRRGEDRILLRRDTTQLDEVQVDKTGRYLVVKTGLGGRVHAGPGVRQRLEPGLSHLDAVARRVVGPPQPLCLQRAQIVGPLPERDSPGGGRRQRPGAAAGASPLRRPVLLGQPPGLHQPRRAVRGLHEPLGRAGAARRVRPGGAGRDLRPGSRGRTPAFGVAGVLPAALSGPTRSRRSARAAPPPVQPSGAPRRRRPSPAGRTPPPPRSDSDRCRCFRRSRGGRTGRPRRPFR